MTQEEKARAYDKVRKKIAIRFGSNVADEFFAEFEESKDEKVRREIINYFQCQSEEEPTRKEIHNKWIAWLENIPVTIDHEKREGFHLGYKAGLEKQGKQKASYTTIAETGNGGINALVTLPIEMKTAEESLGIDSDTYNKIVDECIFGKQKPEENKGNIGGISPNWSEEDERLCQCLIEDQKETLDKVRNDKYGHSEIISDLKEMYHERIDWLKSLKGRLKPQNRWKPSELQLGCLSDAIEHYNSLGYPASKLKELLSDLKKLKEE